MSKYNGQIFNYEYFQAFKANKFEWTEDLCKQDSDKDGRTNGEELGDPDCTWSKGKPAPQAAF